MMINRIWYSITSKSWYAIKLNQPNLTRKCMEIRRCICIITRILQSNNSFIFTYIDNLHTFLLASDLHSPYIFSFNFPLFFHSLAFHHSFTFLYLLLFLSFLLSLSQLSHLSPFSHFSLPSPLSQLSPLSQFSPILPFFHLSPPFILFFYLLFPTSLLWLPPLFFLDSGISKALT